MGSSARLTAVAPTVFFVGTGEAFRQVVRVQAEGVGLADPARLRVTGAGVDEVVRLAAEAEASGGATWYAEIPDIRVAAPVTFELRVDGEPVDRLEVAWTPTRHWEVHLVHYAHHDMGYTDLPSNVLREYDGFYDRVLAFCEETETWPEEDARFRYLVEQAWSVVHYVEHRPPAVVERLMHFVREGRVEITALFGNQTLELCGHEELARLLYPAFGLARRYGFEIVSAEHNDIPGFPWALASVLRGAGIRYFSPGVPSWYYGDAHPLWDPEAFLPMDRPAACWWEGPDGARVLLWSDLHGIGEWQPYDVTQAEAELPAMLEGLAQRDYLYDMVSYTLRGGHRDNAPPTLRYAHLVRAWNARWAYPRLVNATNRTFLERFEQRWGETLPVFRGDVPGTDYPIAATCTPKETAVDRQTHDRLREAELLATLAAELAGAPYPRAVLNEAWRETFYYDLHCWGFHDPGGPAQDAHWAEKAVHAYRAAALAHDVAVKAAATLADRILDGHSGDSAARAGYTLVVHNTLVDRRNDVVWVPLRPWDPCASPMYALAPEGERRWPALVSGSGPGRGLLYPPATLLDEPFQLIDVATGEPVPYQIVTLDDAQAAAPFAPERAAMARVAEQVPWLRTYARALVFVARDLPPVGYRTYRIEPCETWPAFESACAAGAWGLENDAYRVVLDEETGALADVVDRATGRGLFDRAAPHAPGAFIVRDAGTGEETVARVTGAGVVAEGPVFAQVRLTAEAPCCPRIVEEITVYSGVPRVDVGFRVLRDATPMKELYVAFPFDVPEPQFRYEAGNAVIRPIVDQVPGSSTDAYTVQHWVAVEAPHAAPAREGAAAGRTVVWTALDTPIAALGGLWPGYVSEAHHGVAGPGYGHPFLQQDELTKGYIYALVSYNNFRTNFINARPDEVVVRYAFAAQRGGAEAASAFGWGAHNPPLVMWARAADGAGGLPPAASWLTLEMAGAEGGPEAHGPLGGGEAAGAAPAARGVAEQSGALGAPGGRVTAMQQGVVLLALKQAEDGRGLIARLWETAGRAVDVTVRLPHLGITEAFETDLVERDLRALPCREGAVQVRIKAYTIVTIRVCLEGNRR